MTDYDSIWRTQDEIRTVVNVVLGECIWNINYRWRMKRIFLCSGSLTDVKHIKSAPVFHISKPSIHFSTI